MSLEEWNWSTKHVQADTRNGEFVTARSTLLLAGPARLEHVSPTIAVSPNVDVEGGGAAATNAAALFPIGIVQDLQMGSQRPLTRFHEVGSLRSYFVAQRNAIQWQMGRVLFSGQSLMRVFYAGAPDSAVEAAGGTPIPRPGGGTMGAPAGSPYADYFNFAGLTETGEADEFLDAGSPSSKIIIGSNGQQITSVRDWWMNLHSPIFDVPFGVAVLLRDSKNRPYGAGFLEDCMIDSYTFRVSSADTVIGEAATCAADLFLPMRMVTAE